MDKLLLGPRPILIEDGYPIVTGKRVDIVKSVSELPEIGSVCQ